VDTKTQINYDAKALVFKALAHPTRLFIADKLREREYCVCELAQMVGADISTVSKHLRLLKEAGIVGDRKHRLMVFYRLASTDTSALIRLVGEMVKRGARSKWAAVR
jgi:ArsR family transcriptional regulator